MKNNYQKFYESIIKTINLPKLNKDTTTDYVPQGLCQIKNYILITAYDSNKNKNSIIYIINKEGHLINTIYLENKYHVGSISYNSKTNSIYITGQSGTNNGQNSYINKYNSKEILNNITHTIIPQEKILVDTTNALKSSITKKSSTAFLTTNNNNLYLGNFTILKKGIIKKYTLDNKGNPIPSSQQIIKNPYRKTQGLCIYNYKGIDYYLFSTSYGRNKSSKLYISTLKNNKFKTLCKIKLPCLSEQIHIINNNIGIIFESCADKYKNTTSISINKICLLDLKKIINLPNTTKLTKN